MCTVEFKTEVFVQFFQNWDEDDEEKMEEDGEEEEEEEGNMEVDKGDKDEESRTDSKANGGDDTEHDNESEEEWSGSPANHALEKHGPERVIYLLSFLFFMLLILFSEQKTQMVLQENRQFQGRGEGPLVPEAPPQLPPSCNLWLSQRLMAELPVKLTQLDFPAITSRLAAAWRAHVF